MVNTHEEVIGKCYICKKQLTRFDISHREEGQEYQNAFYYEKWPGDHVCCTKHPGVIASYEQLLKGHSHAKNQEPSS